jgi:hypothetical protein
MTPACLACEGGVDVNTYCKCNPLKNGCPIQLAQEASKKLGDNYQFDFKFECFCPGGGRWHTVRVIDGKVDTSTAPKEAEIRAELTAMAESLRKSSGASLAITVPSPAALDIDHWVLSKYWSVTLDGLLQRSAQWSLGHRGKFAFDTNNEGQLEGLKTWMDMDPRIADEEISIAVKDIRPLSRKMTAVSVKKLRSINDAIKSAEEEHAHMEMELRSMKNNERSLV